MKVGRNDPCPCGSGKKYKKCCLEKDEAARREAARALAAAERGAATIAEATTAHAATAVAVDDAPPARDALWEELEAAEPAEVPALLRRALDEPGALDAELAVEMLARARDGAGRAEAAALLGELRDRAPELYEAGQPDFVEWQVLDALAADDPALPQLCAAYVDLLQDDLDLLSPLFDRLCYHGRLALTADLMRRAWPAVQSSGQLVERAVALFYRRARDLTIFAHLARDPQLRADDPALAADLAIYPPIEPARLAEAVELLSGRDQRPWSLDDFALRPPARRGQPQDDPARTSINDLLLQFHSALVRGEGVSAARAELAIESLYRYVVDRQAGRLDDDERGRPRDRRDGGAPAPARHLLCPDRATLDRFLGGLLSPFSSAYHAAMATLELTPAWLRFLEARELLTPDERAAALAELRGLVDDADPLLATDPRVAADVRRAWAAA